MGKFQVNYDWKEGVEGFNEKTSGGMEFNKGDIVTGEASGSWLKVNRGGEYGFIPLNRVDQDGAELAAEKAAAEKARTAARVAEDRLKAPLIGERRDAEVLGASCRVPTDFEIDNAQEGCAPFLIDGVMKHGEKCDKIRCEADPITKEMPTPKGAWPRCTHGVFDDGTLVCQYEEDALEAEVSDASQRASAEQRRQEEQQQEESRATKSGWEKVRGVAAREGASGFRTAEEEKDAIIAKSQVSTKKQAHQQWRAGLEMKRLAKEEYQRKRDEQKDKKQRKAVPRPRAATAPSATDRRRAAGTSLEDPAEESEDEEEASPGTSFPKAVALQHAERPPSLAAIPEPAGAAERGARVHGEEARAAAAERATEDGAAATEDAAEVKKDAVGEVEVAAAETEDAAAGTEDAAAGTEDAAEVKKDEVGEVDVEIKNSKKLENNKKNKRLFKETIKKEIAKELNVSVDKITDVRLIFDTKSGGKGGREIVGGGGGESVKVQFKVKDDGALDKLRKTQVINLENTKEAMEEKGVIMEADAVMQERDKKPEKGDKNYGSMMIKISLAIVALLIAIGGGYFAFKGGRRRRKRSKKRY